MQIRSGIIDGACYEGAGGADQAFEVQTDT